MTQDDSLDEQIDRLVAVLGHNTEDCYRVLAVTGQGAWHPENDAGHWVRSNLRAHHMQAQTLRRRCAEAERTWTALDDLVTAHGLPERVTDPLFDAVVGYRVRRPTYVKRAAPSRWVSARVPHLHDQLSRRAGPRRRAAPRPRPG